MTKSLRLTNFIRSSIISSVMNEYDKNNPKPDEEKAGFIFADYIWNKAYGKHSKVLENVPKDFLKTRKTIYYVLNGELKYVEAAKPLPTNLSDYSTQPIAQLRDTDRQYIKYEKVLEEYEKWKEDRSSLKSEVRAILDSVNTTKQLVEAWPSVEPYLPAHVADPSKGINLPAIQISRLNEKLGLKE